MSASMEQQSSRVDQGQPAVVAEPPERPSLAPNVQLVGQLQGSGFQDQQWLIQRDGQFIQVTELLYRVVEQANGERSLEEIATAVTDATDWMVTADNVRQLIQTKLMPMRLIASADGGAMADGAAPPQGQPRSALSVNLRTRVLSPRIIDPITKVLQVLYAPPVLIPTLLAIAAGHAWLYLEHGVANSLLALVYTPGLLLVVLGIMIIAGIFHEFGHASALRYGGGQVRGMGVGFYLVYPAFYTDVTDSYRLGRWARVRTDLGGFYFYLIFALAMIVLSMVSGLEFLLAIVVLINVDIIRQCLPFVRLDGYWALADLTGLPDFFALIGPFVRSLLPFRLGQGSKLPKLKPWVKAIFILYLILTIPVLALLMLLLMTRLPGIVTVLWDSLLNQVARFSLALSSNNGLGIAAVVSQVLILGLELLGVLFLVYTVVRSVAGLLWNWGKPTPTRRAASTLIMAASAALLAFYWVPQLPFARTVPEGVQSFEVVDRTHIQQPVFYPQTPPVGGNHAPRWQNCGFYSTPIINENGVHSLEHGAVWITYGSSLAGEQVESLRQLARRQTQVLVSPFPNSPAPVVASAWGHQLLLDSADDPRLEQFVRAFKNGRQAPERGGPCTEGVGTPE